MSKNFASIYSGGNDASALNQTFFLKKETVRGQAAPATGADFLFTLGGGGVNFAQPYESSPHRSGRHNNNIIKQKTTTEWSLSTLLNIKQSVAYGLSIDTAVKMLWEAMLGKFTDTGSALKYDSGNDPSVTFTLFENLDHMAKQAVGCFVNEVAVQLPGDGMSKLDWKGNGKTVYHAGIGKSTVANAANDVTLQPGEARRFDVGALVMLVKGDGTTRSSDTATPRTVTASDHTLDKVTLSGAALTDADGTVGGGVFLTYWEPLTPTGIDEPQTGLQGSVTIANLPTLSCVRSAALTLTNNHELVSYCFGTDGLSGPLFVPGGRLEAKLTMELNLNAPLVEFMQRIREFEAQAVTLVCGPAAGRRFEIAVPRVIYMVPSISVPDTGSIPVSFEGTCLQSALDAADEVTISYK